MRHHVRVRSVLWWALIGAIVAFMIVLVSLGVPADSTSASGSVVP